MHPLPHSQGIVNATTPMEQVKVLDEAGLLRVVYPSKVDLPELSLNFR